MKVFLLGLLLAQFLFADEEKIDASGSSGLPLFDKIIDQFGKIDAPHSSELPNAQKGWISSGNVAKFLNLGPQSFSFPPISVNVVLFGDSTGEPELWGGKGGLLQIPLRDQPVSTVAVRVGMVRVSPTVSKVLKRHLSLFGRDEDGLWHVDADSTAALLESLAARLKLGPTLFILNTGVMMDRSYRYSLGPTTAEMASFFLSHPEKQQEPRSAPPFPTRPPSATVVEEFVDATEESEKWAKDMLHALTEVKQLTGDSLITSILEGAKVYGRPRSRAMQQRVYRALSSDREVPKGIEGGATNNWISFNRISWLDGNAEPFTPAGSPGSVQFTWGAAATVPTDSQDGENVITPESLLVLAKSLLESLEEEELSLGEVLRACNSMTGESELCLDSASRLENLVVLKKELLALSAGSHAMDTPNALLELKETLDHLTSKAFLFVGEERAIHAPEHHSSLFFPKVKAVCEEWVRQAIIPPLGAPYPSPPDYPNRVVLEVLIVDDEATGTRGVNVNALKSGIEQLVPEFVPVAMEITSVSSHEEQIGAVFAKALRSVKPDSSSETHMYLDTRLLRKGFLARVFKQIEADWAGGRVLRLPVVIFSSAQLLVVDRFHPAVWANGVVVAVQSALHRDPTGAILQQLARGAAGLLVKGEPLLEFSQLDADAAFRARIFYGSFESERIYNNGIELLESIPTHQSNLWLEETVFRSRKSLLQSARVLRQNWKILIADMSKGEHGSRLVPVVLRRMKKEAQRFELQCKEITALAKHYGCSEEAEVLLATEPGRFFWGRLWALVIGPALGTCALLLVARRKRLDRISKAS